MMEILDRIAGAVDDIERAGRRPSRIEIGEAQARAIADELNEGWHLQHRLGFTWDNTAPKPIEWERIVGGNGWLFGVRIRGVESPDYLGVVADG